MVIGDRIPQTICNFLCFHFSHGRKIDFRNTIVIMTSNLGANMLAADSERTGLTDGDLDNEELVVCYLIYVQ
jgi:hypothetical protein